ncbi:DUF2461 domain-containing protein [Microbacterium candidum]|uniref:DUF2461 domain-containing protein n=1 Tax=Microbacterium candidum TaxID=3041922 RepID=A0ABT7MWI9_9MICO|nr:DUF2461 domain-containing protein [Microbacterium sp. ASV49]MDL9978820.1 DUF2461 domain-containing protein [Microbacterium sp. ASV49]
MSSGFAGWPQAALDFYAGLEVDNSKAYWTAHRAVYDEQVLAPMQALLADLEPEFGEGRIFRPYRDVRFSSDKSPYKTAIGAMLGKGGYVRLASDGLAIGAGAHMMTTEQLARYRAAVADPAIGDDLESAIADLAAHDIGVVVEEQLKTLPRGFGPDAAHQELLRNKDIAAWKAFPIEPWLHSADAADHVAEALRATRPLTDWLAAHVGGHEPGSSRKGR